MTGTVYKLTGDDYADPKPTRIARNLLGKVLCVRTEAGYAEGIIVETEAYGGYLDLACHGSGDRRTKRTEIMFAAGGFAYVYLCYGLHRLFNIITGPKDSPEAVLIRAVKITAGHELVRLRRANVTEEHWANGPGKVSAALGIELSDYGCDLTGNHIWVEDRGVIVPKKAIQQMARVGVDYAGTVWAAKPWRFMWE